MTLRRPSITPLRRVAVRLLVTLGLAALLPSVGGCGGYQQSGSNANAASGYQWSTLYRGDVRSVAVPIFTNRTYYRGIEFDLSKAVVNQIETQSPYKVMPRERADTVLEGEIARVRVRTLSDDRFAAIPQEQLYALRVHFTWRDLRNGKVLVEERDFEQTAPYYPTLGEDSFVAEQQNVERLALAIVQRLQAAW